MMIPKIKYWTTLDALEKGETIIQSHLNECSQQWEKSTWVIYHEEAPFDELHKDAIIKELVKNKYIICGDTHQSLAIPVFNDGYILVSMRVWREIMKEAYFLMSPFKDIKQKAPNFYMASVCNIEEVIPCTQ